MTKTALTHEALLEQERRLVFDSLSNDCAIELGLLLVKRPPRRRFSLTIDIARTNQQSFYAALPGTAVDNDMWVERKRAVVERSGMRRSPWLANAKRSGSIWRGPLPARPAGLRSRRWLLPDHGARRRRHRLGPAP